MDYKINIRINVIRIKYIHATYIFSIDIIKYNLYIYILLLLYKNF